VGSCHILLLPSPSDFGGGRFLKAGDQDGSPFVSFAFKVLIEAGAK